MTSPSNCQHQKVYPTQWDGEFVSTAGGATKKVTDPKQSNVSTNHRYRWDPCMVYIPAFVVDFYSENVGIPSYMDPMGYNPTAIFLLLRKGPICFQKLLQGFPEVRILPNLQGLCTCLGDVLTPRKYPDTTRTNTLKN